MRKTPYTSQTYIDGILEQLQAMKYTVFLEPDLCDWAKFLQGQPATIGLNATFNPQHHDLKPGDDLYWLRVMQADKPVACIAYRMFDLPGGWISFLRSGRLWSQYLAPLSYPRVVHPTSRDYVGRIGHHGGLWVHPEHRGQHLNFYLTHLVRARSLQYYNVDHHCGVVFEGLKDSGLPLRPDGYAYERLDLSMEGFLQTVGQQSRLYTTYISRAGMLKQIAAGPQLPQVKAPAALLKQGRAA